MLSPEQFDELIKFETRRDQKRKKIFSSDDLTNLQHGDLIVRKNLGDIVFDYWEDGKMVFYKQRRFEDGISIIKVSKGEIYPSSNGQVNYGWRSEVTDVYLSDGLEYVRRMVYLEYMGLFKNEES